VGNAFQVCLFLVADLIAGRLSCDSRGSEQLAGDTRDRLTAIYAVGIIFRPNAATCG